MPSFLYFFLVFFVVVNIHEFGHFLLAKISGVKVEEYGFGWPPRVFSKVFKGTRYSLNLLLAGGFVKIYGRDPGEEGSLKSEKSFQRKRFLVRLGIMLGGVTLNLFLAFFIFYFLFLSGMPRLSVANEGKVYVQKINNGSPAQIAGFRVGDQILMIAGHEITNSAEVADVVDDFSGQEIEVTVLKDGESVTLKATPSPYLGITVSSTTFEKGSVFSSFRLAGRETLGIFKEVLGTLCGLVIGRTKGVEFSGPVGIAQVSANTARAGAKFFWQFVAVLSLNLAVLNLIPFPALDGGWVVVSTIEAIRRKRFNQKVIEVANSLGFAVIIGLLVLVTIKDVLSLN